MERVGQRECRRFIVFGSGLDAGKRAAPTRLTQRPDIRGQDGAIGKASSRKEALWWLEKAAQPMSASSNCLRAAPRKLRFGPGSARDVRDPARFFARGSREILNTAPELQICPLPLPSPTHHTLPLPPNSPPVHIRHARHVVLRPPQVPPGRECALAAFATRFR